jgi:spore maturation protein CgeB
MKPFTLIKTNYNQHVSMDLYHEFEANIIKKTTLWEVCNGVNSWQAFIIRQILKLIKPFTIPLYKNKNYVILGHQNEKFFPYFHFKAKSKTLWMYDAWEPLYDQIEKTIRNYNINLLLTASKQSAAYFNTLGIKNFKAQWVPEAVDVSKYYFTPYTDRTIDVLQLGRRWNFYHDKIKSIEKTLNYQYEKQAGTIIFATREDFLKGLANSKISICVPSAITHPEITGSVSTITNRFFQSMASKCLILGKLPDDMLHLFDYNPIIEIDDNNAENQIYDLLKNYEKYVPLIEKNYEIVKKYHNWNERIKTIENAVNSIAN